MEGNERHQVSDTHWLSLQQLETPDPGREESLGLWILNPH